MELLYFANPYCSWCWGFVPVLGALRQKRPDIGLTVALGSLGVDASKPLSPKGRKSIAEHWRHVTELSGQPIDEEVLERPDLVYDTAPASKALMLVRQKYPTLAPAFLGRMAERFFCHGEDLADTNTLGAAASEFGFDAAPFAQELAQPVLDQALLAEWQQTHDLGVTGYPTLLALGSGKPFVVTIGWAPVDTILQRLSQA